MFVGSAVSLLLVVVVSVTLLFVFYVGGSGDSRNESLSPVDVGSSGAGRVLPDSYYEDPWVYFIGDSYTEGSSYDGGRGSIWSSLVCEERGWYERNLGEFGSGYATNGRGGSSYLGQISSSRLDGAAAIVISGGINDVVGDASLEVIASRISQTFTLVRSYAPRTPFTVFSVFDPFGDLSPRLLAVNEVLRAEAERVGAEFIWTSDVLGDASTLLAEDRFHPSSDGHAAIARLVGHQLAGPRR